MISRNFRSIWRDTFLHVFEWGLNEVVALMGPQFLWPKQPCLCNSMTCGLIIPKEATQCHFRQSCMVSGRKKIPHKIISTTLGDLSHFRFFARITNAALRTYWATQNYEKPTQPHHPSWMLRRSVTVPSANSICPAPLNIFTFSPLYFLKLPENMHMQGTLHSSKLLICSLKKSRIQMWTCAAAMMHAV